MLDMQEISMSVQQVGLTKMKVLKNLQQKNMLIPMVEKLIALVLMEELKQ